MAFENIEELKKATEQDAKNKSEKEPPNNQDNVNNSLDFEKIANRLQEINDLLADEDMPLEESLKYYEEAVKLGLEATQKVESNINETLLTQEENNEAEKAEHSANLQADHPANPQAADSANLRTEDSASQQNTDKTNSTTEAN